MKPIILLTAFLVSNFLFAQDSDPIKNIKKKSIEIKNNLDSFKNTEVIKDSLGSRNIYTNDSSNIIVIKVISFDSENNLRKEVYWCFENRELIFTSQLWENIQTEQIVNSENSYWRKRQLIGWTETDGNYVPANSFKFLEFRENLLQYTDGIIIEL